MKTATKTHSTRATAISLLAAVLMLAAMPAASAADRPAALTQAAPPSFEELAEKLLPAVVNISTTTTLDMSSRENMPQIPNMPQLPPGSPFEDFFKEFYDQFKNQQPPQPGGNKVSSLGSGFVIDAKNGYIVTNNHVIKGADEIRIILQDDMSLDATLVGVDDKTDLAVLKVDPAKATLTDVTWGDSDKAKVGSWVLAIGNPFGLGGTVTAGIVSARQRDINAGPYDEFIQTDASINRGNSGGPMFNMNGQVIGVNTAIFSPSGGSVGIGFAVPSNLAQNVVTQLIKYGQTRRGWLGVRIQDVTDDIAESLELGKARGALVSSVTKDSPAAKAGIEAGDVILSFNGEDIDHMRQLPRLVAETEVGKTSDVTLWRKGKKMNLSVALGQLEQAEESGLLGGATPKELPPEQTEKPTEITPLGFNAVALTDDLRDLHKVPATTNGIMVASVSPTGAAAERGIAVGDVIIEVDQKEINSPADALAQVAAAQKAGKTSVLLFISRRDDRRFVAVKLEK